jgi:hypothetical protein
MSDFNLAPFRTDELSIVPSISDRVVTLCISGSATTYRPDELRAYLQRFHAECMRVMVTEVAVDVRNLEFMNSAGFSTFIDWLVTLQEEDKKRQYTVRYLSNNEYTWQRRSLHALQCLAVDLVKIETL